MHRRRPHRPVVWFTPACALLALALAALPALAAPAAPPAPPRGLGDGAPAAMAAGAARSGQAMFPGSPDVQINLDPGNTVSESGVAVAVAPGGTIHVVWNGDETQKSVWYAHSTDGGLSYSLPVRLNDAVAYPPSYSVYQPDIAVGPDGTVYVTWFDYRAWTYDGDQGSPIDVYLDRSTDGGLTWGTDVLASVGGFGYYQWHFQPYLAVDPSDGDVLISFTGYDRYWPVGDGGDIWLARSTDHGATFATMVRVDDLPDTTLAAQSWSSIAVGPAGDVYVAFEDQRLGARDIRVAHSPDGVTFDRDALVEADTANAQLSPDLDVDRWGRVHLVYVDWSQDADPAVAPFDDRVRYARSLDGGVTFGAGVTVGDVPMQGESLYDWPPRVAADRAGHVHVVWFDFRQDTTLGWYDHSDDGLSFGADQVVSADRGAYTHAVPRLAMLGDDDPCVAWIDRRNGTNFDVFATRRKPVAAVEGLPSPAGTALALAPNPARGTMRVAFTLPAAGAARVEVCDAQGRRVRTLHAGALDAGAHALAWDGTDDAGHRVAAGAYWVRVAGVGTSGARVAVRLE